MMIAAVPLYDKQMQVHAYVFRYQKDNPLFSAAQTTNIFDGGARSVAFDMLVEIGLDSFTLGKPIFVPIEYVNLVGDFGGQYCEFPENVIFVFDTPPIPDEDLLERIEAYRSVGYRFAVNHMYRPEYFKSVLALSDYFFLSQRPEEAEESKQLLAYIKKEFPKIAPVATHVRYQGSLNNLDNMGYALFESRFVSVGITEGQTKVSQLKANVIRLMNIVQDENFEFEEVSRIVQGDPALTISLLKLVNAQTGMQHKIRTITHAVTLLGQKEVRRWVVTAFSTALGVDRPNEITRISLIRAKFCENLALQFGMDDIGQELFLMGLFSVLDIILEVTMRDALAAVRVADTIYDALVMHAGKYYPVLNLVINYENASWQEVSRQLIVSDIRTNELTNAYLEALCWYRNLIDQDILYSELVGESGPESGE